MSGVMTFGSGSTRNHFVNTIHQVTNNAFTFNSGSLCRNYFQNLSIQSTNGGDWLGLNAGVSNWITLQSISIINPLSYINLPAFTNPFTIYVNDQYSQGSTGGYLVFTGTGSASTIISIQNSDPTTVRIPSEIGRAHV